MGLLADILARKEEESAELARRPGAPRPAEWPIRDVCAALSRRTLPTRAPLRFVAEVKLRSPSAGPLSRALDPAARASVYERAGASMVSVLTDSRWFDGSFEHLAAARALVGCPLLCKDFVIDPVQVARAWSSGADAVLVIVRCLPADDQLLRVVDAVRERGLEPFVEVATESELDRALSVGARIIGVNTRDLDTLVMDAARAARVLARIPPDRVAVHLSGVRTKEQVRTVADSRADAALIGEALMRQDDPHPLLASLVAAGSG
jgi:indole-3-glycerol phosphate synthase